MRIEFLQGAEADLLEVYVRLEEQREGRGERFYRTLDFALESLRQFPGWRRYIEAHIGGSFCGLSGSESFRR